MNDLVQDCSNSIANALLLQSCTKPSICETKSSAYFMGYTAYNYPIYMATSRATYTLQQHHMMGQCKTAVSPDTAVLHWTIDTSTIASQITGN